MRVDEQYQIQRLIELRRPWVAHFIRVNPEVTAPASTMEPSSVEGGIDCQVWHAGNCTNIPQKEVAIQLLEKE